MLARIPLGPIVLLALVMTMLAAVIVFVAVPMVGAWNSIAAVGVAAALSIPMALAFSHHEHADGGH